MTSTGWFLANEMQHIMAILRAKVRSKMTGRLTTFKEASYDQGGREGTLVL